MQASQPDPVDTPPQTREILQFQNEEEFRAWAQENVADWEQFVEGALASMAELRAWRAAGHSGFPSGWVTRREYERQRALRSRLQ
jgi:hypothetical protein